MNTGLVLQAAFWTCIAAVAYAYFLYPVLLLCLYMVAQLRRDLAYVFSRRERRVRDLESSDLPTVSVLIPAYNEEERLAAKLANLQLTDYPSEKLEIIFVSDGSTDQTNAILSRAQGGNLRALFLEERKGKPNGLNQAVQAARHDVLVLSDAATLFEPDAIRKLARHFTDPRVGAVCGALRFDSGTESQQTEGVYWKYECALRLMEARLGATLTASGAIYALRKECFRELPVRTMIEDFVVPMQVRQQGLRVLYDPEAEGTDFPASSVSGEFTRRVRLAIGSFRALPQLLRVRMDPMTLWAFLSHKLLRWMVPFFLLGALVSNLFLLPSRVYAACFLLQAVFYAWALLGFLFRSYLSRVRFALVGYFLLTMNLAFMVGFWRYLFGREEGTWQRVN